MYWKSELMLAYSKVDDIENGFNSISNSTVSLCSILAKKYRSIHRVFENIFFSFHAITISLNGL